MTYARQTTLNPNPGGDTTKQAIVDKLDVDLTNIFADLNAHADDLTAHGITSSLQNAVAAQSKGLILAETTDIVGAANLKGLWIFDTLSAQTITDRSGNGHTATCYDQGKTAINANTMSPAFAGLAPNLLIDATHVWAAGNSADFTATVGNSMSLLTCCCVTKTDVFASVQFSLLEKIRLAANYEYSFRINAGKLEFTCYQPNASVSIGRRMSATVVAPDQWHTYGATYGGGTTTATLKVYMDGARVDDADSQTGSLTSMVNGSGQLGAQYDNNLGQFVQVGTEAFRQAIAMMCSVELTAAQMRELDFLWRSYCGVAV